jgi:acetolactate synthase-1/3 small subunit
MEQIIITGVVKNKPGVLASIADKFRQLNININSLNTSETDDPAFNCITIVTDTDGFDFNVISRELTLVAEIKGLEKLNMGDHYERELLLVKIALNQETMPHIMQIGELFRAKVDGIGKGSITLELVDEPAQIKGFLNMLKPFGILGMSKTGRTAIKKD